MLRVKFSRYYICVFIISITAGSNGMCMDRPISFLLYICLKLISLSVCAHLLSVFLFLYVSLLSLYVSVFPIFFLCFQYSSIGTSKGLFLSFYTFCLNKLIFLSLVLYFCQSFRFSLCVSLCLFVSLCVFFSLCFCVSICLLGTKDFK